MSKKTKKYIPMEHAQITEAFLKQLKAEQPIQVVFGSLNVIYQALNQVTPVQKDEILFVLDKFIHDIRGGILEVSVKEAINSKDQH